MLSSRLKIRVIWITALAAAVFALLWLAIIPSGKITYSTNFKDFNDFIRPLTPPDRVNAAKDGTQELSGDPVYFSLRTPRPFNQAKVTFKFQIDSSLPILQTGVSTDGRNWQYNLQPLYNAKLEELLKNWSVLWEGDTLLLQRTKQFNTISDFLKNPPDPAKIALSNYNLKTNYLLPGYEARPATTTICRPLVGAYQFYTYIKDENLTDDFVFQDLNRNLDPDPIDINVYYHDKLINTAHLDDDGVLDDSGAQKPWRHLKLDLANLPEGVYKVEVRANGDIVTRTITTAQSKTAFINTLPLADTPEVSCGRDVFTNGQTISVQTSHPAKLGKITLIKGGSASSTEILDVNAAYQLFSTNDLPTAGTKIILANDGVSLSGDGIFAFSPDGLFDPRIKTVDVNFNADKEGIDYVLAHYTPPVKDGDWLVASANFDLTQAFRLWNKYYFLISAPGLQAGDGKNRMVRIKDIKVDLTGTSLLEKFTKFFKK
jgi:hypothetical protein